jgi:hypothetical protein
LKRNQSGELCERFQVGVLVTAEEAKNLIKFLSEKLKQIQEIQDKR